MCFLCMPTCIHKVHKLNNRRLYWRNLRATRIPFDGLPSQPAYLPANLPGQFIYRQLPICSILLTTTTTTTSCTPTPYFDFFTAQHQQHQQKISQTL